MKKPIVRTIWIVLSILVWNCTQKQEQKPVNYMEIDISDGINTTRKKNLSSIAKDIHYIPLETTNESMLGGIRGKKIYDSLIFIHDDLDRLFIFNRKGKFLRKFNYKGRGPGEYTV